MFFKCKVYLLKFLLKRHTHVSRIVSRADRNYNYDVYWVYFYDRNMDPEYIDRAKRNYLLIDPSELDNKEDCRKKDLYIRELRDKEDEKRRPEVPLTKEFLRDHPIEIEHTFKKYKFTHHVIIKAFLFRVLFFNSIYVFLRKLLEIFLQGLVSPTNKRAKLLNIFIMLNDQGRLPVSLFMLVQIHYGWKAEYMAPRKLVFCMRRYRRICESLVETGELRKTAEGTYSLNSKAFESINKWENERALFKIQVMIMIFTAILGIKAFVDIFKEFR